MQALGKLKDRFPAALRVHLSSTNIRDVVHRRLLRKKPQREADLRRLFHAHRAELALYAYQGDQLTEQDFVDVYPMLPGHVDLLMQITTGLRVRSVGAQRDTQAVRGLLQMLGSLFREQRLVGCEVGCLLTLDRVYEVLHPALDPEVQATLAAAREQFPDRVIWTVFEPHTFSRTKALMDDFTVSFDKADHVIVLDIYPAREVAADFPGVTAAELTARMAHPDARHIGSHDEAVAYLLGGLQPGDVLITLGAGDGYLIGERVLARREVK